MLDEGRIISLDTYWLMFRTRKYLFQAIVPSAPMHYLCTIRFE